MIADRNAEVLRLANLGFHLVPWKGRKHVTDESRPLVAGFLGEGSARSAGSVAAFTRIYPAADWACVPERGIALDLDRKSGRDGVAALQEIVAEFSDWSTFTRDCPITETKSGGLHIWFRQPDGGDITCCGSIAPGVEFKSRTGSVHVPPSFGYRAVVPLRAESELPRLPVEIADRCRQTKRGAANDYRARSFGDGERRLMLCSVAGKARSALALNATELFALLTAVRDERCDNPETFTDEEVAGIARDFAKKAADDIDALALAGDQTAAAVVSLFSRARR